MNYNVIIETVKEKIDEFFTMEEPSQNKMSKLNQGLINQFGEVWEMK